MPQIRLVPFADAGAGGSVYKVWLPLAADNTAKRPAERIPVILDTDIGDDIDDTWALAMLLRSPQLDLKLVTTTYGKSEYRAKIIAKMLTVDNRTDVPVGVGRRRPHRVPADSRAGSRIVSWPTMRVRYTKTVSKP